jgi:DNA helicase MCM9
VVIRRWKALISGERCDIDIAIVANHVRINNDQNVKSLMTDDLKNGFEKFWNKYQEDPLKGEVFYKYYYIR